MQVEGYDIDVVVQGYPGKTVCHGGLGWSTIVLIRGHGRVALVDVGGFNIRVPLVERLKARGLTPKDVTDLLITHAHHDHCINWTLFSHARIVLGKQEMEWAKNVQWGIGPVPELYVEKLLDWKTLHMATEGEEVLPGITAHIVPGHTPGHLLYRAQGQRPRRDLHWRFRQEPRRVDLRQGRRHLRPVRQRGVDCVNLDDVEAPARQCRRAGT